MTWTRMLVNPGIWGGVQARGARTHSAVGRRQVLQIVVAAMIFMGAVSFPGWARRLGRGSDRQNTPWTLAAWRRVSGRDAQVEQADSGGITPGACEC